MLTVDGAQGEGGGQILRTALALSFCVNQPFRMINIRARRRRPGLQYQHLAAVHAAAQVSAADVSGATKDYLQADVPIGRHLADQLLVCLALAGGGRFVTMRPSLHTLTTIAVIQSFISIAIDQYQISDTSWQISFDH